MLTLLLRSLLLSQLYKSFVLLLLFRLQAFQLCDALAIMLSLCLLFVLRPRQLLLVLLRLLLKEKLLLQQCRHLLLTLPQLCSGLLVSALPCRFRVFLLALFKQTLLLFRFLLICLPLPASLLVP